ncbi:MAG: hypothetical protein WAN10_12995 [Candidatus Acidiferrales bacterium]
MLQQVRNFFRDHIASRIRPTFWLRTRYTRALEEEILRLRAENRALVNSILGVAGIPPMRAVAVAPPAIAPSASVGARLASPGRPEGRPYEKATAPREAATSVAPPRRRSWQQIGRALEIADARAAQRERESDTETFPPPRKILIRP